MEDKGHLGNPLWCIFILLVLLKWVEMENATRVTLTNVSGQAVHALDITASQFAAHSITVEATGLPMAAAFGFMPGLMFGLKRG